MLFGALPCGLPPVGGALVPSLGPLRVWCPCDHTAPEDWENFKICPLHTGRDTLVGWSLAEALQQHQGWPTNSHAHQATERLFRDPLIKDATLSWQDPSQHV